MGQTSEGAKKAAITAKLLHGADYHKKIGSAGGKKSRTGGFAALSPDELKEVARRGGRAKKGYRKNQSAG